MIKLNEQFLGSVLSAKTGLLMWRTKTRYYEIQVVITKHVVAFGKNHLTAQTMGESALKSHMRGSKHKELAALIK